MVLTVPLSGSVTVTLLMESFGASLPSPIVAVTWLFGGAAAVAFVTFAMVAITVSFASSTASTTA